MPKRHLVDVDAAAEYCGTTARHVRHLIAQRKIPYFKVGALIRFDTVELDHWLDSNKVEAHT